ncbi:MAG: SRPBCC family protein [Actinomycetota bacterium]|nr:SRPBCC family protein [Actinomycetota bacterium]
MSNPPARKEVRTALGWFSNALGAVQVVSPGVVTRLAGVKDTRSSRAIMRWVGLREIATGAGILRSERSGSWLWVRVAGDAVDLALLASAMRSEDSKRGRLGAAAAAVAGVSALDLLAALGNSGSEEDAPDEGAAATAAITVKRPIEDVYGYWRDFERLPSFMYHLESVRAVGERRSHWVARAPGNATVEWAAELVEDIPGRLISWRSVGGDVDTSGSVWFSQAPGDRGTEVKAEVRYRIPGGRLAGGLAKLFGESPEQQIKDDLRRFKQVLETGEVVVSEGSPEGSTSKRQFMPEPAQPSKSRANEELVAK